MFVIPIHQLRRGETAEVAQVVGAPDQVRRLAELGVRSGEPLEMIQAGSPCIIRVGGATLCFRDEKQLQVIVSPRKSA